MAVIDLVKLGLKIQALRALKGYSQRSLSAEAGVAYATIQDLEKGEGNPTIETLEALSKTLGEPLIELFDGRVPATHLSSAAMAGLKQETEAKRNREAAQIEGARGKRVALDDLMTESNHPATVAEMTPAELEALVARASKRDGAINMELNVLRKALSQIPSEVLDNWEDAEEEVQYLVLYLLTWNDDYHRKISQASWKRLRQLGVSKQPPKGRVSKTRG